MKEHCIRCGKESEYDTNAPITLRRFYVEGSGQLCAECWRKLYGDDGHIHVVNRQKGDK